MVSHWYDTSQKKIPSQAGFELRTFRFWGGRLNYSANEAVHVAGPGPNDPGQSAHRCGCRFNSSDCCSFYLSKLPSSHSTGVKQVHTPLQSGRSRVRFPLSPWGFFRVQSYQWLKIWHFSGCPARRLALRCQRWDWSARCQYTVTG